MTDCLVVVEPQTEESLAARGPSSKVCGVFPLNRAKAASQYAVAVTRKFYGPAYSLDLQALNGAEVFRGELARWLGLLRSRVFIRDGFACVKCTKALTVETGELHEKKSRGKGGFRTMENCVLLCAECHRGSRGEHVKVGGR